MTYLEYRNKVNKLLTTKVGLIPRYNEIKDVGIEIFLRNWDIQKSKGILSDNQIEILDETKKQLNNFGMNQHFNFDKFK